MNAPQTKIEATSDRSLDSISAVVGIGHSDWRADYAAVRGGGKPTDSYGYGAVSLKRALADAGIDKSEVDGLIVGSTGPDFGLTIDTGMALSTVASQIDIILNLVYGLRP